MCFYTASLFAAFVALNLVYKAIESEVERLFKGFALVLYKKGMPGHMYFYFGDLVFDLVGHIIQYKVNFCINNTVVKGSELIHLLVYTVQ